MANKIKKRGRYSAAMKEEIAWQATLGQKTDEQIASEYQISVSPVQQWRDEGKAAFSGAFRSTQNDAKMKKLLQENEHLKSALCKRELELEWLSKKWKELAR